MKYEWIEADWRKHEGLCYFETGKNKEWRVTVWESPSGGYDITVHFRRAYQVLKYPIRVSWMLVGQARDQAEELFEEIKSSIND